MRSTGLAKIIWLTGISGAGKSTIAEKLANDFHAKNEKVTILDGDVVRDFFENDLGYSRSDRIFNVKRIAFAAKLLADVGQNVIVANIAPYCEVRDFVRRKLGDYYIQVFLNCSLKEAIERDVKGLYKLAKEGKINNLIGVDDVYEPPRNPHLKVDSEGLSLDETYLIIKTYLQEHKCL